MESEQLQIFSILISLVSIFISFSLGQWSKTDSLKKHKQEERYLSLYIPFFKKLMDYNYPKNSYYQIVILTEPRFVRDNILVNVEYLDNVSVRLLKNLIEKDKYIYAFSQGNLELEPEVNEAEILFSQLVESMKKESIEIAKKLKLEPVTKDLL